MILYAVFRAPQSRPGPEMIVEVILLDGSPLQVDISSKASGSELIDAVAANINLLEKDYFGMTFYDKKDQMRVWVQNDRKLTKQLKEMKVWFQVRFYPPDPAHLQEDLTRYQLCLQIQQDVKTGKLPCSFVTHALLGAYLVQSELGDYDPVDHGEYLATSVYPYRYFLIHIAYLDKNIFISIKVSQPTT